jgi:hypothetical protein
MCKPRCLDIIFCHVIILYMYTMKYGKSVSVICSMFVQPQSCKNSRTFGCSWRSIFTKICRYIAFQPCRGWGSQFAAVSKQRPRFIPGQSIWCLWWIKLYSDRLFLGLDVCGSVHHNTIHKEKSNKMQQCIRILLFHIYMKLNMFRATHHPSSGA